MRSRIGWFRCEGCDRLKFLAQLGWRSPFARGFGVCRSCYAEWDRFGRRCPRCWAQVKATQRLGFFTHWKRFGHFDCGAALLA